MMSAKSSFNPRRAEGGGAFRNRITSRSLTKRLE